MGFNLDDYEPVAARLARWQSSPNIGAIASAIVEAVGGIEGVAKTRTAKVDSRSGSGYSYKYADLSDVIASTKAILKQNGLVALQTVASDETSVVIATTLLHSSGEWIAFEPLRLPLGRTAQEIGSAITYGRRYTLLACLGIAAEDDDGASAAPRTDRSNAVSETHHSDDQMAKVARAGGGAGGTSSSGSGSYATPKQLAYIRRLAADRGHTSEDAIQAAVDTVLGTEALVSQLTPAQASRVIEAWK